jgi:hypothetical protein
MVDWDGRDESLPFYRKHRGPLRSQESQITVLPTQNPACALRSSHRHTECHLDNSCECRGAGEGDWRGFGRGVGFGVGGHTRPPAYGIFFSWPQPQ